MSCVIGRTVSIAKQGEDVALIPDVELAVRGSAVLDELLSYLHYGIVMERNRNDTDTGLGDSGMRRQTYLFMA